MSMRRITTTSLQRDGSRERIWRCVGRRLALYLFTMYCAMRERLRLCVGLIVRFDKCSRRRQARRNSNFATERSTTAAMGPPLMPTQAGFALTAVRPAIQIECFLDLICPFSSKMFGTVYRDVIPKLGDKAKDISFIINQVPQPWHPQGAYVHEAALAVKSVAPSSYPAYVDAIYKAFDGGAFKDDQTWDKSRGQIYGDLMDLLKTSVPDVDVAAVQQALALKPDGGNAGNMMTQHIKWAAKYHRTRGVHVTPTVHVNGLEAGIVGSGWTADQWLAFLEPMGADNWQGSKLP